MTSKPKFIPRPAESAEVIEARWKKKKARIEHLSTEIRRLRLNITSWLKSDDEKEFLTALVIAMMDKTFERIGNNSSAENGHYGVTGWQKNHVAISGNQITLHYTGKSGVEHEKVFSDEKLARALKRAIKNSPSKYIFETSDGFRIKADRVNRVLKDFGINSKDLRGYGANRLTSEALNKIEPEETDKKRKKQLNKILKGVAGKVGHGRPTLKKHYLVPELWDTWVDEGKVIDLKDMGYLEKGGEAKPPAIEAEDAAEIPKANFNKVKTSSYQIFEVTANRKSIVAKIFVRPQVHYDNKEFKGRIFTLDEFKDWYSGGKEFTYYYDWNGFNVPDSTIKKFIDGKFNPLTPDEKWLIENIKSSGINLREPFYLVGYSNDDESTRNHELSHALYYLSSEYKKSADKIIDSIPKHELGTLNDFMGVRKYHPSVYKDEMQAYLMADKDYLQRYGGWNPSYEPHHHKLVEAFNKYFNKSRERKYRSSQSARPFNEYYAEEGWLIL